jgi:hypothetical protein
MFSGVVLVDGRPECSSTDVRLSLKCSYNKKVLLWLMALSPKASYSNPWVSAAVFLKIQTKFHADSLLLKIGHISCQKKFAGSLQPHKNVVTLITCPLSFTTVSTQIHKTYC